VGDRRVSFNMKKEYLAIRKEHGFPGGVAGMFLELFARVKRLSQKLFYRRKLDLISGKPHTEMDLIDFMECSDPF
jgi:hypothetical protein